MRNRQLGVSLLGLIVGAVILIFVLLLAMKTLPPWLDYFAAKKLIVQIAQEQRNGSVVDIRRAWQLKASVDNVDNVISDKDLEITKEGGEVVISFAYRKEVPLFANVGVYMDFAASSKAAEKAGN
jgi:hypothetical protein